VVIVELGESWDAAPKGRCDVLVLDGAGGLGNPGEGVSSLRARAPGATLVVHGVHEDRTLRASLLAGGADLVFDSRAEFDAIRDVLEDLLWERRSARVGRIGPPRRPSARVARRVDAAQPP
jgi:DNA-binding NarL/FixJ family response regulator